MRLIRCKPQNLNKKKSVRHKIKNNIWYEERVGRENS
jgi:hypothetical protein